MGRDTVSSMPAGEATTSAPSFRPCARTAGSAGTTSTSTEKRSRTQGRTEIFNDAWGRERTTPFFGQTLWEGYEAGDRG